MYSDLPDEMTLRAQDHSFFDKVSAVLGHARIASSDLEVALVCALYVDKR